MSGFTTRCACRDHRPSSLASVDSFQRPSLVTRLLKERDVARFIVAPHGYGKTLLALDYAETMFAWSHVFWFSAQSPCFIRDLDAHLLVSACFDVDPDAALVVIDDLPPLDPGRSEVLSEAIDDLLARGCEVLVTCAPSCDVSGGTQRDCMRIGAWDLLLSDEELDESRTAEDRLRQAASRVPDACRVPALVWGKGEAADRAFARGALSEELPADYLLAIGSVLVLQNASLGDLQRVGVLEAETAEELSADYPHLGFDAEAGSFEAVQLSIEAMAQEVKKRLGSMATRSKFDEPEELAIAWSDILLQNGFASRACEVMQAFCPRAYRGAWLVENAWELVRLTCFEGSWRLARDAKGLKGHVRMRMSAVEALCLRLLGDEQGAIRAGKRCAFDAAAPEDARVCGALVVSRLGKGAVVEQAQSVLAEICPAEVEGKQAPTEWQMLALAWCASERGPELLSQLWERFKDWGASDDVLCICASWMFGLMGRDDASGEGRVSVPPAAQRQVERFVRERLSRGDAPLLDYFAASAGLSLEEAHERGVAYGDGPLDASALFGLRQIEMEVLAQRNSYEKRMRLAQAKRENWVATRPDSYLAAHNSGARKIRRNVPDLRIKLFGSFEVSIGDEPLGQECFRRQNVRALLTLLTVNQGKEISRDQLSSAMWPLSSDEVRRKNFYTVWAQLKRIISLDDGTCPYLVRHQYGCSLEQRHVKSDVERFSTICRELLFGKPDIDRWAEFFAEIDRDFSSDLMPSERHNQMVIQARNEYRSRLVDALVSATYSILEEGHPQWGIWFARSAIAHDNTREDAYVALMRAQVAGNQRTAAMMTFMTCRRTLGEQLGIDPSPEANALYESLLGA